MGSNVPGVRLSDVARIAGVSLSTASRTLAEPSLVRPETRQRVEQAAARLGYVPHGVARALASRRSRTIGAVVPTVDNPIFATATQGIASALRASGHTLLLASDEYDPVTELAVTRALVERGVDGLVLIGVDHSPDLIEFLQRTAIPYELTLALDPGGHHHCVGFSNRLAASRMTRYLLDLGHRSFAVISGFCAHNDRARERLDGVREALASHGLRLPEARVVETEFTVGAGRKAMAALLERAGARPFSAVVCGNDLLGVGALLECAARGIPVPGQISVTGFDDIELAAEIPPGLTTVHVPSEEIGRLAATRLLDRLAGKSVPRQQKVAAELVVRGSAAAPPARRGP